MGTFKFCMIHKTVPAKTELSSLDEFILHSKYRLAGSKLRWYGLDTSSLILERVPLITGGIRNGRRIQRNKQAPPKWSLFFGDPYGTPRLRAGRGAALTCHRQVIHSRALRAPTGKMQKEQPHLRWNCPFWHICINLIQ